MRKITSFLSGTFSKRIVLFACFLIAGVAGAFAQDAGITAITDATSTIAAYIPVVSKLIYAIAAVVGVVGAFSVYHDMQNGEQDVKKKVMLLIGSCIFLCVCAAALPKFFGHTNSSATSEVIEIIVPEQSSSLIVTDLAA